MKEINNSKQNEETFIQIQLHIIFIYIILFF